MSPDPQAISKLIDRYQQGISTFESAVRGAEPSTFDSAPAPGKWSIRQIAAHLTDSESVAAVRYRMIAAQPGCRLTPYDQDKWAEHLIYTNQPLEETLIAFAAQGRLNVAMLRNLTQEAWARTAIHEERGEYTLYGMVEHNAGHTERHTEQVLSIRQKSKF
jgi:acyl transferase domain-containing protein